MASVLPTRSFNPAGAERYLDNFVVGFGLFVAGLKFYVFLPRTTAGVDSGSNVLGAHGDNYGI